jgi:hypothetical protein
LLSRLSANPLCCFTCTGEVAPETLGLSDAEQEAIAHWRALHDSVYQLWLDSADYEDWARGELERTDGPVHVRGRAVRAVLSGHVDALYGWFCGEKASPRACPLCGQRLVAQPHWLTCGGCAVAFRDDDLPARATHTVQG